MEETAHLWQIKETTQKQERALKLDIKANEEVVETEY